MVDPVRLPTQLRPHIFPRVVKQNSERPTDIGHAGHTDPADLRAENDTLRAYCAMWRRRAEAHAAVTLNILDIARTARRDTLRLKIERDELQTRYNALKRKQEESEHFILPPSLLFAIDGPSHSPTPSSLIFDDEEEDVKPFNKKRKTEPPETPPASSCSPTSSLRQFFQSSPEPGESNEPA